MTGSGAGPSAAQVKKKSTPRAIVRPSRDKTLRESIKANRDEANKLAKELQESLAKRERLQAAKTAKIAMSPAITIPLTPDGTKNRHRSDRVERDASDNLQ